MNAMCRHQNLTVLPKHWPKKLNQAPCTICYIEKMKSFPICKNVDTTNLQPGELIHMEFSFYNVTFIRGLTSMLPVVCARTRIIWLFLTASKRAPVRIIHLILKTFNNGQHKWKCGRVDEDGTLEKSKDITNLLVDDFIVSIETTGGDASCINGKNEIHNRIIHNIVISILIGINKHENKWCCEEETSE